MRIAGIFSFKNGREEVAQRHHAEFNQVLQVIEGVDAGQYRVKSDKEGMAYSNLLYDPSSLEEAFNEQLVLKSWISQEVIDEISRSPRNLHLPVKNELGVEVSFNVDFSMVYSGCAKMTIFANMGVIDCGIEIVPVKAFAEEMSTGVSYFEQFVWDLEHRGVSDIDIPVLILGIDTDGVKPEDLKIAEARQMYVF